MPTSYPGGLDAFTNPAAGDTLDNPPHDVQHADTNDAVEAIEVELGTDPSGTFPTVRDRVEGVEAALSGLVLDDIADVDAPTPVDGQVLTWNTGTAVWRPETPSGGGGGAVPAWVTYLAEPVGAPHPVDDEFNDGVLDPAWTLVQPATPVITAAEGLDVLSLTHPGGGPSTVSWNLVKPFAPAGDFTLETAVRMVGTRQNYQNMGVVAADGAVYGAGSQASTSVVVPSNNLPIIDLRSQTNYNTAGTIAQDLISFIAAPLFLRLRRVGGTWTAFYSADAVSWRSFGALAFPVAVTHVGVFITPAGGAGPLRAAFEYVRVTEP